MAKENYYITHLIVPNLPEAGLDQLFYYTTRDKTLRDGKFYWGRGNNSFDTEFINRLLDKNEIQKLKIKEYPLAIKESETLLVDKNGNIYKTCSFLPLKKKIGKLEIEVKK